MSEKKVNINITANTKDFNSAIDKAQKQIEGLADALDKIGSSKIGEKLEDQFGNLTKVIKTLEDQITNALGVFDKLEKTKLDKAEDGLEDANKAAEKLNETLEDTADNAKDLDNASKSIGDLGKEYRTAQSSLEKLSKEYEDAISKQKELGDAYEKSKDEVKELADKQQELTDAYDKATKVVEDYEKKLENTFRSLEDLDTKISDVNKEIEDQTRVADEAKQSLSDTIKKIENLVDEQRELEKQTKDLKKALEEAYSSGNQKDIDKYTQELVDQAKAINDVKNELKEAREKQDEYSKAWRDSRTELEALHDKKKALEELSTSMSEQKRDAAEVAGEYDKMERKLEELREEASQAKKELDDFYKASGGSDSVNKAIENLDKLKKNYDDASNNAEELKNNIDELKKVMEDSNKAAQEQADAFDKQYKAYQRLSKEVEKYINDESKAITLREQVAKSFQQVANAMEGVYSDSKKLNNMDNVTKVLKEAKEYLDDFNLVSLDNVNEELDKFNKRLEDTIDKQKRYKAISKEFGSDDSKLAYRLEKQSQELKEWADSADFVIEASDKLTKAWGNVSAAGEDDLKIRERSKYIDEYGKTLEKNVAKIQSFHKELKTLDEVYEKATAEEKAIIDDYKAWDKNKESLDKYNQAIRDYLTVIKESGGQISDKFKDDLGNFDVKKFIENYEKFGEANNVLKKSLESLKIKTLESVESLTKNANANKEAAKEAVKNAEAVRNQAKEEKKAAETQEERAEAAKKLAKAEEDLAEAKRKVKDFDKDLLDNLDKLIKKYNEGAEAARKLGINMKEITKADISKLDGGKAFGSLLDDMKTFGDDLPKTFDDFKRQIEAVFADMKGLDLGSAFDGLKEIGAGALDTIADKLDINIGKVGTFVAVLKQCADWGVDKFTSGMDTISSAMSGVIGVARSVGTEIRDAFENITGMHLDMSSLLEIPVEYESIMAQVKGITGASELEFERLKEVAREWGGTTRYSATEVGEAMTYMGMAGWGTQEVIDGIGGVLNVATAGAMDLAKASDFVTDGLTAMGMEAKQANEFVDMLAGTIVNSNTGLAQMQNAYKNVGSLAGGHNVYASELNTVLGLMADKGVKGAKAGTAAKNMLSFLAKPTEERLAYMKEFGLEGAVDKMMSGDLIGGIKEMKAVLDKMDSKQKDNILTTLFGREALPGMAALFNSTNEQIDELQFNIESSTKAGTTFAKALGLIDKNGKMTAKTMEELKNENSEAYQKWVKFNDIIKETSTEFAQAGGTGDELGAIIHKLGEDGDVTADNIRDVISVFNKLGEGSSVVLEALEKIGVELKYTDDGAIDMGESLKVLATKWDDLTDSEKKWFAEQLGITGSLDELNELFANNGELIEDLIKDYEEATGAAQSLAEAYDNTLKGSLLNLASAIEERLLKVFDKIGPAIRDVVDEFTEFFNIWNDMGQSDANKELKGLADALAYLEETSRGWGQAISDALANGIAAIDNFVNSTSFDNMLQVGTNIINGIADGIQRAADNGTLDSAITTAIGKIATWFSNNLETIVEVGGEVIDAISQGISENSDVIGDVIVQVIELQTKIDNTIAYEKWKLIGANLATFIVSGFKSKATELCSGIGGFLVGLFTGNGDGTNNKPDNGNILDTSKDYQNWTYKDPITGNTYGPGVQNGKDYADGVKDGVKSKKEDVGNTVNQNFKDAKVKTDTTASEIGQGISDNIVAKLETMDTGDLAALRVEMENLGETVTKVGTAMTTSFTTIQDSARTSFMGLTNIVRNQMTSCTNIIRNQMVNSANIVRNQCVNMANIFRNQFVSMANVTRNQMVNVSNIIRNQSVNWANIISNQVTNARNTLTSQFLSMAAVSRTQMVNISNIIRNQSVSWSNIISNQAKNARDNLTRQFISMAKVVATQMKNCLSSVNSYMSKIAKATNKKMSMSVNVNKTVSTSFAGIGGASVAAANALYAANNASTYSLGGDTSALASRASAVSSGGGTVSSGTSRGGSDGILLEMPVYLDGREVARATAKYVDGELKRITNRENRKRGAK